jgi:hypothetical protein
VYGKHHSLFECQNDTTRAAKKQSSSQTSFVVMRNGFCDEHMHATIAFGQLKQYISRCRIRSRILINVATIFWFTMRLSLSKLASWRGVTVAVIKAFDNRGEISNKEILRDLSNKIGSNTNWVVLFSTLF